MMPRGTPGQDAEEKTFGMLGSSDARGDHPEVRNEDGAMAGDSNASLGTWAPSPGMGTWWQHPALASCRSSKHPPALGIAPFVGHRARQLGICLVVLGGCWGDTPLPLVWRRRKMVQRELAPAGSPCTTPSPWPATTG